MLHPAVALATEQYRAGEPVQSRETLLRAADSALMLGSPETLTNTAIGLVWLAYRLGLSTGPARGLLEEALRRIGPEDNSLRAKILAGLDHHRGLSGNVDVLPEAVALTRIYGDESACRRFGARIEVSLRNGRAYRRAVFITSDQERAGSGSQCKVSSGPLCLRTMLAECCDGDNDETRIDRI
jgi:hypothetical protein